MPAMVLFTVLLTACGGAEDGDEDIEFDGYFTGTLTPDGAAAIPGFLYVAQDGDFYIGASPKAIFAGSGDVNGTAYTATGVGRTGSAFANGSTSATFSFTGNVSAGGGTLTGAYSGGNESGTYTFQWDNAVSSRAASLAAIAGTYHFPATGPEIYNVIISPAGDYSSFYANTGCVLTGQIRVLDANWNHYSWQAAPEGMSCPGNPGAIQGHAFMTSATAISLFGMQSNMPVFLFAFR
jgi:hypothetical protein